MLSRSHKSSPRSVVGGRSREKTTTIDNNIFIHPIFNFLCVCERGFSRVTCT